MQAHKIEKRLPFGFMGDWGRLYKRYVFDDKVYIGKTEIIEYQNLRYMEIGMDVQFKIVQEIDKRTGQPLRGSMLDEGSAIVKTTDAYFDEATQRFECIVKPDDIVFVFGLWWKVKSVRVKLYYTPAPQGLYFCDLERIER